MLYVADGITLETTANMDGWRAFYDASQDYELDANTSAYIIEAKSSNADEVELKKLDVTSIPHGEAVILKTSAADHKMVLTKTTGATTLGAANKLTTTDGTNNVDGYRLGYGKIGSDDAVGFFRYKTTAAPAAGIVYVGKDDVNHTASAHGLSISFGDDNATAVQTVSTGRQPVATRKLMKDGRVVVESVKGTFTLSGARMK